MIYTRLEYHDGKLIEYRNTQKKPDLKSITFWSWPWDSKTAAVEIEIKYVKFKRFNKRKHAKRKRIASVNART
jgi:hypothetical protein